GLSYRTIARKLGTSPGAISGKVARWMKSGLIPQNHPGCTRLKNKSPQRKKGTTPTAPREKLPPIPRDKPLYRLGPLPEGAVGLMDLKDSMCGVVISDVPLIYCAKRRSHPRWKFCKEHEARMLVPRDQAKRQRFVFNRRKSLAKPAD